MCRDENHDSFFKHSFTSYKIVYFTSSCLLCLLFLLLLLLYHNYNWDTSRYPLPEFRISLNKRDKGQTLNLYAPIFCIYHLSLFDLLITKKENICEVLVKLISLALSKNNIKTPGIEGNWTFNVLQQTNTFQQVQRRTKASIQTNKYQSFISLMLGTILASLMTKKSSYFKNNHLGMCKHKGNLTVSTW